MIRFFIPLVIIVLPIITTLLLGSSWLTLGLVFDIILIILSIKIVSPNTVKSVEFFGKFNRILRPGLNFIIPFIEWTKAQVLYRRNFQIDVEGITHDNVTAYIGLNVIYYVEDDWKDTTEWNIYKSIYMIDDPRIMIRATIDEQLRAMMVTFSHKNIFEKREEIGEAIEARLRVKLSSFGYKLDSIQVKDVKLDPSVMAAMNKVVETQKLREAALNEAEAEKIKIVKSAEADKDSKILMWEGMAGQRMKIAEWFKESVELIQGADKSLNAQKILEFLLDSSRIETLGEIGSRENAKIIYLNEDLEWRSISKSEKLFAGSDLMK